MSKPKIYVFSGVPDGGEGPCYALSEDGAGLGSHWCSDEEWARYDLGVEPGYSLDRHECYAAYYPDGYEMEFLPAVELDTHEGFKRAFALNQEMAEREGDNERRY